MPRPARPLQRLDLRLLRLREATARRLAPARVLPLQVGEAGLPARLHLPCGAGPFPAVLLLPGGLDGMSALESLSCVLTAPFLARHGFATLIYGPSGREGVPGEEDHNGPRHQAEAAAALERLLARPEVDPDRVAVATVSFGLVAGMGALVARPELAARVRAIVDWEGPGHRRWFTDVGIGAPPEDDDFWVPREAVRMVGRLACPYWRMQSSWDHVHGPDAEIGREMVRAALAGSCPEVRFNGVTGTDRAPLVDPRRSRQRRILLGWLRRTTAAAGR